jgi:hypothetical protein
MIKSKMRWKVHVERMGEKRYACKWESQSETATRKTKTSVCGNININLGDRMGWCGLDWSGSDQGQVEELL